MKAQKHCKCRPEDRRLTFINLNGQNTYVCRVCGRLYANREQRPPERRTKLRVIALAVAGWAALIIWGIVGR